MTKASDNQFPSVLLTETASASVSTPSAGNQRLFIDTDHAYKTKNSSGTVTTIGGGGGGITHSYLGYNTAGGSTEAMTSTKVYAKKVTVASAGIITSVGAYIDQNADFVAGFSVAVFEDVTGTPGRMLSANLMSYAGFLMETASTPTYASPTWRHFPIGLYVTAADYWIAISAYHSSNPARIYYDGSGSDRTYTTSATWLSDWGRYTPTTTSNKYSIRASLIY